MSIEQVTITDSATGSRATVLVGFGFNCYSFQPILGGKPHEVLWSAPGFATGTEKPSHSGTPILFPYPGRLRGKTLRFGGQAWPLEGDDGRGNAIHGYVLNRPWRVIEKADNRVVGEFHAATDEPGLLEKWPSDFRIRVSYEIVGNRLNSEMTVDNPGNSDLPFGLGTHAYFCVPLGAAGKANDCVITVPVREYWELVDMLPSGKLLPAAGDKGLGMGMLFVDTKLDDIFTGIQFDADGWATATIADPLSQCKLTLRFDRAFTQCVVYNPPHREAICIEPYTCLPDTYQMRDHGVETGLQILKPGESFTARTQVDVA